MPVRQRTGAPDAPARTPPLRRVFTVQLSLLGLLGVCLVALIGSGWVFAFGVIIGRGFEPDKKLPLLGRLMPPAASAPEQPADIIKPEDLTFFSDLKAQPTLSDGQPASAPSSPSSPAGPVRQTPPQTPTQTPPVDRTGSQAGDQPDAGAERYSFVFQAIAYKSQERADLFRETLENDGLRTRLQVDRDKRGKPRMYRIQILFTGTDAGADQVREALIRHGVRDPAVTSRKPIRGNAD